MIFTVFLSVQIIIYLCLSVSKFFFFVQILVIGHWSLVISYSERKKKVVISTEGRNLRFLVSLGMTDTQVRLFNSLTIAYSSLPTQYLLIFSGKVLFLSFMATEYLLKFSNNPTSAFSFDEPDFFKEQGFEWALLLNNPEIPIPAKDTIAEPAFFRKLFLVIPPPRAKPDKDFIISFT